MNRVEAVYSALPGRTLEIVARTSLPLSVVRKLLNAGLDSQRIWRHTRRRDRHSYTFVYEINPRRAEGKESGGKGRK